MATIYIILLMELFGTTFMGTEKEQRFITFVSLFILLLLFHLTSHISSMNVSLKF